MEQALEGGDKLHRMKPGRKPKIAAIEAIDAAAYARIDEQDAAMKGSGKVVNGCYYPPGLSKEQQARYDDFCARSQAYAMRVWAGQSVDVPPAERKERVFNALRGQNLSTDGIVFPA